MALEDLTGHDIAYVVGNPGSTNANQDALSGRLTAAGATVTYVDDNNIASVTAANGYTAWVIDESSASGTVGSNLATSTLPGFHGKLFAWDEHNIAGAGATVATSQTQIDIVDDSHYIAINAGVSNGTITIYTTGGNYQYTTTANMASGADLIATAVGDGTRFVLGAVESGATLLGGSPSTAPARRVLFGCWNSNPNLDTDGDALFDAGINWMLGFDSGPGPQNVTADPADYARVTDGVAIRQGLAVDPADYARVTDGVTINLGIAANPADYSRATDGIAVLQGVLADAAAYDRVMSFVIINGDTGGTTERRGSNGRLRRVIRRDLGR